MKGNTKSVHGLIFLVVATLLWMGCPNTSIETLDNNFPNESEEEDAIETPDNETPDNNLPNENEEEDAIETPDNETPDNNLPNENEEEDAIETPDNETPDNNLHNENEEEDAVQEIAGTVVNYSARNITFSMITVPGGIVFPTGVDDSGRETVENAFMIGETEVPYSLWNTVRTWAQNRAYRISSGQAGSRQAGGPGPFAAVDTREPVTSITWYDAAVWCNALTEWVNAQTGTSLKPVYYYRQGGSLCKNSVNLETFVREDAAHQFGSVFADSVADGFRLPAAKEWELAARWQGTEAVNAVNGLSDPYFCKGDSASGAAAAYTDEAATRDVSVYNTAKTAVAGSKEANGLGLFDMSGNVYEWCYDWSAGGEGSLRITRGGSIYDSTAYYMQIGLVGFAAADAQYADIGFRVARAGNE